MSKRRSVLLCSAVVAAAVGVAAEARAGQVDFTVFLGGAYPVHDERLTIRPTVPSRT